MHDARSFPGTHNLEPVTRDEANALYPDSAGPLRTELFLYGNFGMDCQNILWCWEAGMNGNIFWVRYWEDGYWRYPDWSSRHCNEIPDCD